MGVPRVSGARGEDGNWRPSPSACQTGTRRRRFPHYLGVWGGAPAANAFERILVELEPFLNSVLYDSQLGVSDWQAPNALSLTIGGGGGLGWSPSRQLLRAFGCKWNPFLNSVNTIFH